MKRWFPHLLLLLAVAAAWAAPQHVYRISGSVVSDRDGSPVARCRVSASQLSPQQSQPQEGRRTGGPGDGPPNFGGFARNFAPDADSVVTDSRGHFSLTVESSGLWRLTGVARGFRTQAFDAHETFSAAIALSDAAPEATVTLRLTPDATITGLVLDEAGDPVRNAQVSGQRADQPDSAPGFAGGLGRGGPRGLAFAQTDDRGRYELTGLAPGGYRLSVQAQPWYADHRAGRGLNGAGGDSSLDPSLDVVYAPTWFPAATDQAAAETITLAGGEVREADFHLIAIPSIHLLVPRNDPQPTVADGNNQRGIRAPSVTRQNGIGGFPGEGQGGAVTTNGTEWDFSGLAPGSYTVRLPDATGRGFTTTDVTLAAGTSRFVSLSSATSGTPVILRVEGVPGRTVRSIVLTDDSSGQTYTAATPGGFGRGRNNDDGDDDSPDPDRSLHVPAGSYTVTIFGDNGAFLQSIAAQGAQTAGRSVTIGDTPVTLTLSIATGRASVSGIAKREGKPLEGAMVLLVPVTFGEKGALASVVRDESNTDGSFYLTNVLPAQYILVAIDHGWAVNWRDETTLAQYLLKGVPVDLRSAKTLKQDVTAVDP